MPGFWSSLSFSWMVAPVRKARHSPVGVDELYFPEEYTTDNIYEEFEHQWATEMHSEKTTGKAPSLIRTLFRSYGKSYMLAGLCKILWSILVIAGAFYFVRSLLLFANDDAPYTEQWHAWTLSACFFVDAYLLGMAHCLPTHDD
jgi:ATP-binding cassette, subfamily C (CFTR/MRP), member 1